MKRNRPERFQVWVGIAGHPTFEDEPLTLVLYIRAIGWITEWEQLPSERTARTLLACTVQWEAAFERLVAEGAFVFERGFMRVAPAFGGCGRVLYWELPATTERPPVKRRALSATLRFAVLQRDQFRCVYCGAEPGASGLHVDHVTPVSRGGSDDVANLVTACVDCNLGKSDNELQVSV